MSETSELQAGINDLEKWIEEHGPKLFLFAQQQTGNHADAQDVYQEAIVKVLKESLHEEGGRIPPLGRMFLAIKHGAIDLHRRKNSRIRREQSYEESVNHDKNRWFIESIEVDEQHQQLRDAVHMLPPEQQEVVILKVWGEQTFKTISEILGIPQNTAASRFRYGLSQIRSTLNLQAL